MSDERRRAIDYLHHKQGEIDGDLFVLAGPPWPTVTQPPPETEVVVLDESAPLALIRENLDINERGFDPSAAPVTEDQAAAFRPQLRGARTVTVRLAGQPAAGGMVLPVHAGVAELAGITTLARYRRRGLGRLTTVSLIQAAATLGADLIILSTSNEPAARLYSSLGFRVVSPT